MQWHGVISISNFLTRQHYAANSDLYVGITRAQLSLNISWCARRKQGKEIIERSASRFIAEMDGGEGDVRHEGQGAVSSASTFDKASGNARLANFKAMLGKSG